MTFSLILGWSGTLTAGAAPGTGARAAVLYEANTGTMLYSHNPDERRPIASITKIMTALVVLENRSPEEFVKYKREWTLVEGSSSGFREGQWYSIRQLLYALMLASGNDAAVALACHTAGSVEAFAEMMNTKASELGMANSSFKNPHGLDQQGHYSTASDMARLATEAMKNKDFALIASTKEARLGNYRFTNHNKLLWKYPGTAGIKTGYTSSAGRTLVTCLKKNNMTLVCVTLNDGNDWNDHIVLYDWATSNYSLFTIDSGSPIAEIKVVAGVEDSVLLKSAKSVRLLTGVEDEVAVKISLPHFVYAHITANEKVGEAVILVNGEQADKVDILFNESVPIDDSIPLTFWEKIKWTWDIANQYPHSNWLYVY